MGAVFVVVQSLCTVYKNFKCDGQIFEIRHLRDKTHTN